MPNRRRTIDRSHPLGGFAEQLCELRDNATARAGGSQAARELSIDKVATGTWETSRTAIYAALNGTRLASMNTLCAMVSAWHPRGEKGIPEWQKLRRDVEEQLAAMRSRIPVNVVEAEVTPVVRQPDPARVPDAEALEQLRILLATALAEIRMTKTQLAARTGLGRTTVHEAFATGRPVPSAATVAAIGRALRLPIDRLLELHRQAVG
ncbi:hypothetical protein ACIQWR_20595 [Streptomyces sp. NPDC098789]|uniref:hypothetical protein n=1 Tax=Streptomyces sp. NPDC098789 TaxID=3366098 RepID=UPI00382EFEA6